MKIYTETEDKIRTENINEEMLLRLLRDVEKLEVCEWSVAPVNISETNEFFGVDVCAPGFSKDDFIINMDENELLIVAESTASPSQSHLRYMEFDAVCVKRSFVLPDNADKEKIHAEYCNGILSVRIPKMTQAEDKHEMIGNFILL